MSATRQTGHFLGLPTTLVAVAAMLVVTPGGFGRHAHAEDDVVVEDMGPMSSHQTSTIESLTPAQAEKLVADFVPTALEVEVRLGMFVTDPQCLILNGLKSLDAKTAAVLAAGWKGGIMLGGLTSLDVDAARALATHDRAARGGNLSLFGLKTLDAATAKVLAETMAWDGILSRLTTLEADVAVALAAFKGSDLYLDGLTEISPEVADALGTCAALNLHLGGVTSLSAAAASALARFGRDGSSLHLTGLTTLDAESATLLTASKAWTGQLPKLERLDAATAAALVKFANAKRMPVMSLGGLTRLDGETARALATFKDGFLNVSGLTSLSVDSAKALAGCDAWNGLLPEITTLDSPDSVAIAAALAARKGPLRLPNLKKVSPKTLAALVEKRDVDIPLIETLELIPEPDGSLTNDDFVIPEGFRQRRPPQGP